MNTLDCFIKLHTESLLMVSSVLYPLTSMFSFVCCFSMSAYFLSCLGPYFKAARITEENNNNTELRNCTLVAAGAKYCRLFLDVAGLVLYRIVHWHSLMPNIKRIIFFSGSLQSSVSLIHLLTLHNCNFNENFIRQCFGLVLICAVGKNLTLLASKENDGGIVVEKNVVWFCSCDFWINP